MLAIEDIDGGIYESMLPLYFPRNQAEQKFACYKLPINIGGTNGEPILPERAIRIQDKPLHFDQDSIDLKSGLEASVAIGRSTFAMMQADVDKRWLKKSVPGSSDSFDDNQYNAPNSTVHYGPTKENQRRTGGPTTMPSNPTLSTNHVPTRRTSETDRDYRGKAYDMRAKSALNVCDPLQQQLAQKMRFEALLRAAQQADVSSVARLDWLYMNGHDRLGRKLLVLIGAHLPRTHPMLQLCFLQLVRSLERMRTGHDDFVLLYVHSNCETADEPSVQFVRRSLDLLPATYVERLSCVYVLHAGLWFRMTSWWFMQFRANWLKTRITFIRSLAELDSTLPLLDLRLPQFVLDHDFKVCFGKIKIVLKNQNQIP